MKSGIWPPLLLGAGIIAAWEIYVRAANIDPLLLPPPSAVAWYLVENAPIMVSNGAATLSELLLGFFSGAIIGLSLGIQMQVSWRRKWFRSLPLRRSWCCGSVSPSYRKQPQWR
jgi:NitT/TauT family transport system permease protein